MIVVGIGAHGGWLRRSGAPGCCSSASGMLGILVGVSLMRPVIGRPVIAVLGLAYGRVFTTVGHLATENARRNPRRTAATASALMIGLTLVALMSILGQSAKASTDQAIEDSLTAQLVVSNAIGTPFSTAIAEQIREVDGVETVAQFRQAFPKVDGSQVFLGAADPDQLGQALNIPIAGG